MYEGEDGKFHNDLFFCCFQRWPFFYLSSNFVLIVVVVVVVISIHGIFIVLVLFYRDIVVTESKANFVCAIYTQILFFSVYHKICCLFSVMSCFVSR